MDKTQTYTFTKEELKRLKEADEKLSPKRRLEVSKAMVLANSEANTPINPKFSNTRDWKALFFEWNNPAFGPYDTFMIISTEELPRLAHLYGNPVLKAATLKGADLNDVAYEEVCFFFLDTSQRLITPMELLSFAFGGQYNDDSPIGKKKTAFDFDASAYTLKQLKLETKPPTLNERITDFSHDSHYGKIEWVPKKKK